MELCSTCGQSDCSCGGALPASGLELDLDVGRGRPKPAPASAPASGPAPLPGAAPPPRVTPLARPEPRAPMPPPPSSTSLPPVVKLTIGMLAVVGFGYGIWFGVQKLRRSVEGAADDAIVRPYEAPSRLVIASVRSDYASSASDDGALLLRRMPVGSAAGLAAWYSGRGGPPIGSTAYVDDAVRLVAAHPSYRALEAPEEPCRGDSAPDSSKTTLGELSFDDDRPITLWTCTLQKSGNTFLLAWAARSSDVGKDRSGLMYMLKGSQLVRGDLCAVNVINGGCSPSAARLIATLIEDARR
ncbi:MAG: hypothetical protein U0270_36825 [Labilithrix sp.]